SRDLIRLTWLTVMKLFSTSRSASERWLGSEACFCCSRQNSISVRVARPMSTTTLPTSVSRFADMPRALLSDWDIAVQTSPPVRDACDVAVPASSDHSYGE